MRRFTTLLSGATRGLRRAIAAEWQGPSHLPKSLMLEWRLVVARWIGILCVAPALPLMHLSSERLAAAYAILIGGIAYNVAIRWVLHHKPDLFANGNITTAADTV